MSFNFKDMHCRFYIILFNKLYIMMTFTKKVSIKLLRDCRGRYFWAESHVRDQFKTYAAGILKNSRSSSGFVRKHSCWSNTRDFLNSSQRERDNGDGGRDSLKSSTEAKGCAPGRRRETRKAKRGCELEELPFAWWRDGSCRSTLFAVRGVGNWGLLGWCSDARHPASPTSSFG